MFVRTIPLWRTDAIQTIFCWKWWRHQDKKWVRFWNCHNLVSIYCAETNTVEICDSRDIIFGTLKFRFWFGWKGHQRSNIETVFGIFQNPCFLHDDFNLNSDIKQMANSVKRNLFDHGDVISDVLTRLWILPCIFKIKHRLKCRVSLSVPMRTILIAIMDACKIVRQYKFGCRILISVAGAICKMYYGCVFKSHSQSLNHIRSCSKKSAPPGAIFGIFISYILSSQCTHGIGSRRGFSQRDIPSVWLWFCWHGTKIQRQNRMSKL